MQLTIRISVVKCILYSQLPLSGCNILHKKTRKKHKIAMVWLLNSDIDECVYISLYVYLGIFFIAMYILGFYSEKSTCKIVVRVFLQTIRVEYTLHEICPLLHDYNNKHAYYCISGKLVFQVLSIFLSMILVIYIASTDF